MRKLRWGIVSTGGIAAVFARGMATSRRGQVAAVASRSPGKARAFAAAHGIARAFGDYAALFADAGVDAVYVATPHVFHAELCVAAARAGKHVLCEKPLAMSLAEARRVVAAARESGVLLMEGFMYRTHPQTARVAALLRGGAVGNVRLVRAAFGIHRPYDAGSRLWAAELGGGAILDVGCYTVSWARFVAGVARGRGFAEPVSVAASARLSERGAVDADGAALLDFGGGLRAQLACGIALRMDNTVDIFGDAGRVHVPSPYVVTRDLSASRILLFDNEGRLAREETVTPDRNLYAYEADAFAEALERGLREVPAVTPEDTLGNMAVLDKWRAAAVSG
ncbi:MAG: Gfo/Idh/MocA family oxidoreductase [Opitutaceae bacterium]|jgi:predicted dehydrogenase|nr:Gfo/Idh/MocA family oxidoreductase [Opitutaceae bacterium]